MLESSSGTGGGGVIKEWAEILSQQHNGSGPGPVAHRTHQKGKTGKGETMIEAMLFPLFFLSQFLIK